MQTPKPRNSWSGAPQKTSPISISSEASPKNSPQAEVSQKISPRVVRQLKTGPRYSVHTASSSNLAKTPKERSSKVAADHRSPRSPASERKQSSKVAELESQISQLEIDLNVVKDQLCSTEAAKKQAQKDAEESNQQLLALSSKLEEYQKQLLGQSTASEEVNRKLQSELDDIRKKHSHDSAALVSSLDEIKQLKIQLELVVESEASHSELNRIEISKLKESLSEALSIVENMKNQLKDAKESETQAKALVGETLTQLETAKKMVVTLKSDGLKATEAYSAIVSELEQSRARVDFLEEHLSKLKAEISDSGRSKDSGDEKGAETGINEQLRSTEVEDISVEQLQSALEAAEIRYSEEQALNAERMRVAFEMVENIKSESSRREEELEAEIRKSKYEIEELKADLMDKETELQGICEENEGLTEKLENTLSSQRETDLEKELHKLKADIENMKAHLMDKEQQWQNISEENEKLKSEMKKMNKSSTGDQAVSEIEAAEREAQMKAGYMAEELDKSNRKAARVAEQLEAAQAANADMETELRRLKVQSDQWRKAAEAAAAMLSAGNNGQLMHNHYSPRSGYEDEVDDDLLKKKNANMLKKIGILWKKPQK